MASGQVAGNTEEGQLRKFAMDIKFLAPSPITICEDFVLFQPECAIEH